MHQRCQSTNLLFVFFTRDQILSLFFVSIVRKFLNTSNAVLPARYFSCTSIWSLASYGSLSVVTLPNAVWARGFWLLAFYWATVWSYFMFVLDYRRVLKFKVNVTLLANSLLNNQVNVSNSWFWRCWIHTTFVCSLRAFPL